MTTWQLSCVYCGWTITEPATEWPSDNAWTAMLVHEKSCERAS